jgi:hypothetical protein
MSNSTDAAAIGTERFAAFEREVQAIAEKALAKDDSRTAIIIALIDTYGRGFADAYEVRNAIDRKYHNGGMPLAILGQGDYTTEMKP